VSAGLAIAEEGTDAEHLLEDADTAMYAAKRTGHAMLKIYDSALREAAISKMEIEEDLRKALREGELEVHYQPVVDLETRKPIGYEALVRWSHPRRGVLLPDEFLTIAEQTNLVVPIGSLVIHEACAFIARHPGLDGQVFVNVSPAQLGENALARTLKAALDQHGVEPPRLAIELTESGFLKTTPVVEADLRRIAGLDIPIIIDDFGTGRGSLATLVEKPVAGIKLAERFARRLGDRGVADRVSKGIALMVRDVGLLAVIKGIETEEQAKIAQSHGWVAGQGFLFGRPLAEEELGLSPPSVRAASGVSSASPAP
jgi:EAL domain-containing protein (putative c-di-GMP-specific phosphodiesterase class I)